jgi:hypothetical protein
LTTAIITSKKYGVFYGLNTESQKPSLAIISTNSRIECGIKCDDMFGCGGFNSQTKSSGLVECNFIQGRSDFSEVQTQNGVTYYQKLDKCWYL